MNDTRDTTGPSAASLGSTVVGEPRMHNSALWCLGHYARYGRFPTAIEYADSGYPLGGQCDCRTVGSCCLLDATSPLSCDRCCYANQLRDFIAISAQGMLKK
jgi:hypothetical protein